MILGLSTSAFTQLHVIISLVGLLSGLVALLGLCKGRRLPGWTATFLITTIATSVTGFMFHSPSFGPPHIIGALSLVILAIALLALYVKDLFGKWRWIYIVTAVLALYFNAFVAVVQGFQKIAFLRALAPTQKEPPFLMAQLLVLVFFVITAAISLKSFPRRTVRGVV
jgi:hypothetical protein